MIVEKLFISITLKFLLSDLTILFIHSFADFSTIEIKNKDICHYFEVKDAPPFAKYNQETIHIPNHESLPYHQQQT